MHQSVPVEYILKVNLNIVMYIFIFLGQVGYG